jgi:surface antigen
MQTIRILMLAGMIAIPFQAAESQLLFGSRLGEAHYQGDDTRIIMGVAADMLSTAPDGDSRPWSNPQTGHHGDLTIVRSYRMKNLLCRDTKVNGQLGDKSVSYILPLCQIADGSWKIAAR